MMWLLCIFNKATISYLQAFLKYITLLTQANFMKKVLDKRIRGIVICQVHAVDIAEPVYNTLK
jgi:hypothetical protein